MSERRKWWLISISGYGDFGYYGTVKEAEEMRAHKAIWEHGIGRKKSIPATHPEAKEAQEFTRQQHKNGIIMDRRELESIGIIPDDPLQREQMKGEENSA